MVLSANLLKARIAAGKPSIVAMLQLPSPALAELLAMAGSDAVIFEAEHSTLNEAQVEDLVRACEIGAATPLCRVPGIDEAYISRVLDAGVMGVVVPHICTAQDAARVVAAVKYPPLGRRGSGTTRASGYGLMARDIYVASANRETMVILMIEDREAVENIDEILAVPGVDCLFIGRGDLSLSLGVTASDPQIETLVDQVIKAANSRKIPFMVACGEKEAANWFSRGASMISLQVVGFLQRHWRTAAKQVHELGNTN